MNAKLAPLVRRRDRSGSANGTHTNGRRPAFSPLEPSGEDVAERAYWIWESEGHPIGREEEHLREARKQLLHSRALEEAMESDTDTC
jgi:hypothetical protein